MTKNERIAELRKITDEMLGDNISDKCRAIAKLLCKKENTIRIALMEFSPRPMTEFNLRFLRMALGAMLQDEPEKRKRKPKSKAVDQQSV